MAAKQQANTATVGIRLTAEDRKLVKRIREKTGVVAFSEIVRQALRALAAKEGLYEPSLGKS
jgi:hypothetical protein